MCVYMHFIEQKVYGFITIVTVPPAMVPDGPDGMKDQPLKEVERVRSFFPETWLWLNTSVGSVDFHSMCLLRFIEL